MRARPSHRGRDRLHAAETASPKPSGKEARRLHERPAPSDASNYADRRDRDAAKRGFRSASRTRGHPQKLASPEPDGGFARAADNGVFPVSVSPEQVARAFLLPNKLIRAIEAQGWPVKCSEKGRQLCPDGEPLVFTLTEQTAPVPHELTDAEREARTATTLRPGKAQSQHERTGDRSIIWDPSASGQRAHSCARTPVHAPTRVWQVQRHAISSKSILCRRALGSRWGQRRSCTIQAAGQRHGVPGFAMVGWL